MLHATHPNTLYHNTPTPARSLQVSLNLSIPLVDAVPRIMHTLPNQAKCSAQYLLVPSCHTSYGFAAGILRWSITRNTIALIRSP